MHALSNSGPVLEQASLFGKRHLSVLHARIRNKCSQLNNDLFNNHLRDYPFVVGAMKQRMMNTTSFIATHTETSVTNSLK